MTVPGIPSIHSGAALEEDLSHDLAPHDLNRQVIAPGEVQTQLERITCSFLFRNSKRYPALLRYIVCEVLAGRSDSLKERMLGISVFGRNLDYDTNVDPVVRISAGEVRKRIAQYYQSPGHEHELRIEIPLGSYLPRFYWPADGTHGVSPEMVPRTAVDHADGDEPVVGPVIAMAAQGTVPAAQLQRFNSRVHLTLLYTLLLALAIAWSYQRWRAAAERKMPAGAALFWNHFLKSPQPTLIVLGVHSFDGQGNDISYRSHASLPQTKETLLWAMTRSDMIHLSDLTSFAQLTSLLTQRNHAFRTQGAGDTTLEQLREGPFILVGGFNNLWTTKLTSKLRFRFVTLNGRINVIQDSQHPERTWTVDTGKSALSNISDYAVVSCFLDHTTDQYVLVAAGIGKSGTEAASDFLTNQNELTRWLQNTTPQGGDNVQIVLSTDVIEGKHGAPHVVDAYRW